MKTLPNTVFPTQRKDGKTDTVARFILDCLNVPPPAGFDFASMRARQRVAAVVEKVADGGNIELEDADYATALEAVKNTRWVIFSPSIIKFAEVMGL